MSPNEYFDISTWRQACKSGLYLYLNMLLDSLLSHCWLGVMWLFKHLLSIHSWILLSSHAKLSVSFLIIVWMVLDSFACKLAALIGLHSTGITPFLPYCEDIEFASIMNGNTAGMHDHHRYIKIIMTCWSLNIPLSNLTVKCKVDSSLGEEMILHYFTISENKLICWNYLSSWKGKPHAGLVISGNFHF